MCVPITFHSHRLDAPRLTRSLFAHSTPEGRTLSPELAVADVAVTPSAVRTVWNSPLYRGATAALFLSGLGTSAAAPQITLFLVNDLHVSLATAGLFYLPNITPPLP